MEFVERLRVLGLVVLEDFAGDHDHLAEFETVVLRLGFDDHLVDLVILRALVVGDDHETITLVAEVVDDRHQIGVHLAEERQPIGRLDSTDRRRHAEVCRQIADDDLAELARVISDDGEVLVLGEVVTVVDENQQVIGHLVPCVDGTVHIVG